MLTVFGYLAFTCKFHSVFLKLHYSLTKHYSICVPRWILTTQCNVRTSSPLIITSALNSIHDRATSST